MAKEARRGLDSSSRLSSIDFLPLNKVGNVLMAFMSCLTQLTMGLCTKGLLEVVKDQHYTWDECGELVEKVRRRLFRSERALGIV